MERYVTTEKGQTFYIHDTPGEKGTIIGIHGLTGNHLQFHHYKEALSGSYRFISYDIRGRGNSDPADANTSIFTHADDLLDLIDTLKIDKPILMGYSMGAYIGSIAASRLSDVEALILLDGAGEADSVTRELVLPSLNRLKKSYSSPEEYVEETRKLYTSLSIEWTDTMEEILRYEIKRQGETWENKSDPSLLEQDFESFYSFAPENIFPSINCDIFLLIATGRLGNKRALFQESSYTKMNGFLKESMIEYTPVNHYELVFNRQPEISQQIQGFLSRKGVNT
ncbi:alpha/beta fold hydrolase [Alkalihalobacillus sp. TS-13]|uniref:alpha/beta fold hydrolase n=1 Tax=Alkalihalobacillus sp. TS-13 TaxID=2842455 RepID=UPI001C878018|nr:alpha/beta hydrolase [Alkalihalobacillus sp. TS-13]